MLYCSGPHKIVTSNFGHVFSGVEIVIYDKKVGAVPLQCDMVGCKS